MFEYYQNKHVIKWQQIKGSGKKIIVKMSTEPRYSSLLSSEYAF